MTKRLIILIVSGAVLLGGAALLIPLVEHRAQPEFGLIYGASKRGYTMRDLLALYGGAVGAVLFMTLATLIPHRALRVVLSVVAGFILLAHGAMLVVLIAIGSSGGVADAAMEELRDRTLLFGTVILLWAFVLVSCTKKKPDKAPQPTRL